MISSIRLNSSLKKYTLAVSYSRLELKSKACVKPELVWVIGTWNLDFVCYSLLGAWNFSMQGFNSGVRVQFDFHYVNLWAQHYLTCFNTFTIS